VAVSPTLVDAVIVVNEEATRVVVVQEHGTPFSYIISFCINLPVVPLIPIKLLSRSRVVFFVVIVLCDVPTVKVAPVLVVNFK
jgi:hypothetical protein